VVVVVFDVVAGLVVVELIGGVGVELGPGGLMCGVGTCANEIEAAPRRTLNDFNSVVRLFMRRFWQRMAHSVKL
jgi:hypothetical protein